MRELFRLVLSGTVTLRGSYLVPYLTFLRLPYVHYGVHPSRLEPTPEIPRPLLVHLLHFHVHPPTELTHSLTGPTHPFSSLSPTHPVASFL